MTQLCLASSLSSAVAMAAAIRGGLVSAPTSGERVLLAANLAPAPELTDPWHASPVAQSVTSYFDRVIVLNDDTNPYHPGTWAPPDQDEPLLERILGSHWRLEPGPVELVLDSLDTPPGTTLARIFHDAPVSLVSAGLAGYGPTSRGLPLSVLQRLDHHYYVDLLDGVRPVMLTEVAHVVQSPIPIDPCRDLLGEMARTSRNEVQLPDYSDRPTAIALGQNLEALGILSAEEETELLLSIVDAALESDAERVVFKPHPDAPPAGVHRLKHEARERGIHFAVLSTPYPAEALAATTDFHSTVSCSSTALLGLERLFGVPTVSVGTEMLLERVAPYQNRNRIPVTVIHALTHGGARYRDPECLQDLIEAVAYCMQPDVCAHLRPVAEQVLGQMPAEERALYVKRRRLTSLGLPGGSENKSTARAQDEDRRFLPRIARAWSGRRRKGVR